MPLPDMQEMTVSYRYTGILKMVLDRVQNRKCGPRSAIPVRKIFFALRAPDVNGRAMPRVHYARKKKFCWDLCALATDLGVRSLTDMAKTWHHTSVTSSWNVSRCICSHELPADDPPFGQDLDGIWTGFGRDLDRIWRMRPWRGVSKSDFAEVFRQIGSEFDVGFEICVGIRNLSGITAKTEIPRSGLRG